MTFFKKTLETPAGRGYSEPQLEIILKFRNVPVGCVFVKKSEIALRYNLFITLLRSQIGLKPIWLFLCARPSRASCSQTYL
ncbi:MAG: hypothetical protein B6I25_06130 [Planctomycetales bacterium 4572_13]|nr:MAG: hypothetical protein B6I25_06130 [Planctomycetales bacterium 4572_13]